MKHQNANITRNVSCVPGLPVHALGSTKAHSVHGIQPTGDAPNPQDDEWSPYLVGGWALHIWKMMEWVTVGMMTFPKKWKVLKAMFQSTNQVLLLVGGKRLVTFGVLVESPWEAWAQHLGFKFIQPAKSMQDMKEQGVQVTNSVVFLGLLVITPLLHMPICDILGMCCARQSSARTSNLFLLVCGLLSCLKMMEMERVARRLKPKNPTHGCWCCFIKCVTEYWFNMTIKSFLIHARIFTRGFDDDLAVSKTGYVNIPGTDSHYPTLSCFDPLASGFTMFYPLKFPPPFGPLRWLSCGLSFSLDRHFAWETADTQTDTLQFTTSNDQHSHCKIWQVVIRCVETFEVQLSHSTEAMSLEAQAI